MIAWLRFILLLITLAVGSLQAQVLPVTDPSIKEQVGKEITVTGVVVATEVSPNSSHNLLKFTGTDFVVFIDGSLVKDYQKPPADACRGKTITATGTLFLYNGIVELKVTDASKLLIDGKSFAKADDEDAMENVDIAVPMMAESVPVVQRQTIVHALLVRELGAGEMAGQTQKLIATATEHAGVDAMHVRFNQPVGKSMRVGMEEGIKYLQLQHKAWPKGFDVSIGFQEKFSGKSGPSAAVACALLLDGMITGKTYDEGFAVTGDMNADGSVEPIGGVSAKIRGAGKGGCKLIAIPIRNAGSVADMIVMGEMRWLWEIQILTIAKYNDAAKLAVAEREEKLAKALADFSKIADELRKRGPALLANPQVQQYLQKIVEVCPEHLSAQQLLKVGQKKGPTRLTLAGSFSELDRACKPFILVMDSDQEITSPLARNKYADTLFALRNLRLKLEPRTIPYADALAKFIDTWRSFTQNPISGANRVAEVNKIIRDQRREASRCYRELVQNPEIVEEMGL